MLVWQAMGYGRLWEAFEACLAEFPKAEQRQVAKPILNLLLYRLK